MESNEGAELPEEERPSERDADAPPVGALKV